jgi:hypothetical protein
MDHVEAAMSWLLPNSMGKEARLRLLDGKSFRYMN